MTETEQKKPEQAKPDIQVETIGLEQRIEKAVNEYVERKIEGRFTALEKHLDERTDTLLKTKEIEVEKALRKGFGLENDPVVHMSDMIEYGRKLALEKAETGKRTPAPENAAGPEGNTQLSPVDELFVKARKGELA